MRRNYRLCSALQRMQRFWAVSRLSGSYPTRRLAGNRRNWRYIWFQQVPSGCVIQPTIPKPFVCGEGSQPQS